MEQQLKNIAQQFAIQGEIADIHPLGNGLINTTYAVVTTGNTPDYVLQNVNVAIFPDIDLLMNNIIEVTSHIRKKLEAAGTPDLERKVLRFVPTQDGAYYYHDGEKYWRVMVLISDTTSKSGVSLENAKIVGKTFAEFQAMLADIPTQLGETIKDFHNIEFRLRQLKEAVADNKAGRAEESEVKRLLDELFKREDEMTKSEKLYREGKLPKRICHCDTKVDNILFDKDGQVLCVIDLDTVMPSFIFSDFGDFLRTAANTTREDDPNLDNISFRFDVFEAFAGGYLAGGKSFLTPIEIENLPYAVALFPYMQSIRFLADYLNGDTYFKTTHTLHNLERAANQFRLLECVEEATPKMEAYIQQQLAQ